MKTIKNIFLISITIALPQSLLASIVFDANGKWATTFDCSEQTQTITNSVGGGGTGFNCDGFTASDHNVCQNSGGWEVGGWEPSRITSDANHPGGGGGRGFRQMVGPSNGEHAVQSNNNSGAIWGVFAERQRELWVRTYSRYSPDIEWTNGQPYYRKDFYIRSVGDDGSSVISGQAAIAGFQPSGTGKIGVMRQSPTGTPATATKGWHDIYPNGPDGSWFNYEFYIKMDDFEAGNSSENGILRVWLNGELVAENTAFVWSSDNEEISRNGWRSIQLAVNQAGLLQAQCSYIDYDDIVIYNQTPPNVDAHGNPFIGPIGEGEANAIQAPTSLRVTQ